MGLLNDLATGWNGMMDNVGKLAGSIFGGGQQQSTGDTGGGGDTAPSGSPTAPASSNSISPVVYSYGGGGGGGSTSTTTETKDNNKSHDYITVHDVTTNNDTANTHDVSTTNDVSNTKNARDVVTYDVKGRDQGYLTNVDANTRAGVQGILDSVQANRELANQALERNKEIIDAQRMEAQRASDDAFYTSMQKQQSTANVLRNDLGMGRYGSGLDSLNYLTALFDDITDQDILNSQRRAENELLQSYFSANANIANDQNEALVSNRKQLLDYLLSGVADHNSGLGTTNIIHELVNEDTASTSKNRTETTGNTNSTMTTTSDNKTTTDVDSSSSGKTTSERPGGGIDYLNTSENSTDTTTTTDSTNDVTTNLNTESTNTVNSTNDVNNMTTGTNRRETEVMTELSDMLDANGNIDLSKVYAQYGVPVDRNGQMDIGSMMEIDPMEQIHNYRTPEDTSQALGMRYGRR